MVIIVFMLTYNIITDINNLVQNIFSKSYNNLKIYRSAIDTVCPRLFELHFHYLSCSTKTNFFVWLGSNFFVILLFVYAIHSFTKVFLPNYYMKILDQCHYNSLSTVCLKSSKETIPCKCNIINELNMGLKATYDMRSVLSPV